MGSNLNDQTLQSYIDGLQSQMVPTGMYQNTPIQNNQLIPTPENSTPQLTVADYISQTGGMQPRQSKMEEVSPNIGTNFIRNIQRFGTGISYGFTHPKELFNATIDYFGDPSHTTKDTFKDLANTILQSYNTEVGDFGNKPAKEIVANMLRGIHANPFDFTLDVISLGGSKLLGKMIPSVSKAGEVEKGIATIGAESSADFEKLYNGFKGIANDARKEGVDLAKVLESAETGVELGSKAEKDIYKRIKQFSIDYDDIAKKYSPETYIGHEETAITQNILRNRVKKGLTDATYAQVEREIMPMLDLIKEGKFAEVKQMAKEGNALAKEVSGAKALYDKGRIVPVSHGLANVEKLGEEVTKKVGDYAGAFSRRAYGTSEFGDIAKQWAKPERFLEGTIENYLDGAISQNLLRGELGGRAIAPSNIKDARFLNREILQSGKLKDAIADAGKARRFEDDVIIDKHMLDALKAQRAPEGSLSGFLKEMYQTGKSRLLSSGTYIGANAITGISQALMNSNAYLLNDILNAIGTRGKLAKELGVFRRRTLPNIKPIKGSGAFAPLRLAQHINRIGGGQLFSNADRLIQNTLAEIASHAELRKAGIKSADRLNAINRLDRMKLGEVIADVKRDALINSPNVPIPPFLKDVALAYNPFWRWTATATQASLKMLEDSPILSNVVLADIMQHISFDKEMQNRLNLGVSLDKPYTTYRIDDRTGKIKEITAEFVPITTPAKALDLNASIAGTVPLLNAIQNSFKGKDKYGNPLKYAETNDGVIRQTVNGIRMKYDPKQGFVRDESNGLDVLHATIDELIGIPNLYNRTLAPLLSGDQGFYQPYNTSILGSFTQDMTGNRIVGGDPSKPRTASDVLNALRGQYIRDYNPAYDYRTGLTGNQVRRFMRQRNRRLGGVEWQ